MACSTNSTAANNADLLRGKIVNIIFGAAAAGPLQSAGLLLDNPIAVAGSRAIFCVVGKHSRFQRSVKECIRQYPAVRNGIGLNADRQDKSVKDLAVPRSDMAESLDIVLPHSGVGAERRIQSEFSGARSFRERAS
jgi:hypothetical protein